MMETYKFLEDENELRFFYDYLIQPLKPHECYFMSLSARNKRLSAFERDIYQCGRSEMFLKEVVTEDSYERILKGIRRLEPNKLAYLTKSGQPYPEKCLVLYWNIVPVNAYKAMQDQILHLISIQKELTDSSIHGSESGLSSAWRNIRHSHTTGQSVFARSFSEPDWIDIDVDVKDLKMNTKRLWIISEMKSFMEDHVGKGNFAIIETFGGMHWLVRNSALKEAGKKIKGDPVSKIIHTFKHIFFEEDMFDPDTDEIIRNSNQMIPLPSTIQYGEKSVTVMNKEDFVGTVLDRKSVV
jgi:hypothetical protein